MFGLVKVCAEVLADNDAALKAQAAAGFRREGYFRAHVVKDGARRDVVRLGLMAEEWAARRPVLTAELVATGLLRADAEGGR